MGQASKRVCWSEQRLKHRLASNGRQLAQIGALVTSGWTSKKVCMVRGITCPKLNEQVKRSCTRCSLPDEPSIIKTKHAVYTVPLQASGMYVLTSNTIKDLAKVWVFCRRLRRNRCLKPSYLQASVLLSPNKGLLVAMSCVFA